MFDKPKKKIDLSLSLLFLPTKKTKKKSNKL